MAGRVAGHMAGHHAGHQAGQVAGHVVLIHCPLYSVNWCTHVVIDA